MPEEARGGESGIVVVDKDKGWTSHDVVAKLRGVLGTKKIGHSGTLDPMATGVLVLGVNKATRLLPYVVGTLKAYTATIRLGQATVTDDAEGDIVSEADAHHISVEQIRPILARLSGRIMQRPSKVSAIKVNGRRSYAAVRAGKEVTLAARPVTVTSFEVRSATKTVVPAGGGGKAHVLDLDVKVQCSPGTYVRALARDLGESLGVGGHLTALRRTQVGPFGIHQAKSVAELEERPEMLTIESVVSSLLPTRYVSDSEANSLVQGGWLSPTEKLAEGEREVPSGGQGLVTAAVVEGPSGNAGRVVALLRNLERDERRYAVPSVVFGLE